MSSAPRCSVWSAHSLGTRSIPLSTTPTKTLNTAGSNTGSRRFPSVSPRPPASPGGRRRPVPEGALPAGPAGDRSGRAAAEGAGPLWPPPGGAGRAPAHARAAADERIKRRPSAARGIGARALEGRKEPLVPRAAGGARGGEGRGPGHRPSPPPPPPPHAPSPRPHPAGAPRSTSRWTWLRGEVSESPGGRRASPAPPRPGPEPRPVLQRWVRSVRQRRSRRGCGRNWRVGVGRGAARVPGVGRRRCRGGLTECRCVRLPHGLLGGRGLPGPPGVSGSGSALRPP